MCECYQIGGRFIAEDPDCEVHGRNAEIAERHRELIKSKLAKALDTGTHDEIYRAALNALEYLQSL